MLDLINKYSHGFAFVPVILACRKQGLFELLSQHDSMTLQQLADRLGANDGHLQVALRMMQSLKWISRNDRGEYSLTPEAEAQKEIPEEILELFNLPIDSYLVGQQHEGILQGWIKRSSQRWNTSDPLIADFLDGILVIRVLMALNKNNLLEISEDGRTVSFPKVSAVVREELHELFVSKGWGVLQGGRLFFTDVGHYMVDRVLISGTMASYTPMFRRVSDLLFGDPSDVFRRDTEGHETHVDRTLNVVASGFQHEKYFTAVDDFILSIFDKLPYKEQPKYIVDMGCGDGTLLKRVYEVIRSQSARGAVLERHPIMMIGVDYNEEALQVTARTLFDIPSLVLKGDVGDPKQLIEDLKKQGINDPENILHIRSFLDHDRPYLFPTNVSKVQARSILPYKGVYVDTQGHLIPSHVMVQSLVEHLQRWSTVVGNHGLVIVEVHCLEPEIVYEFLDRSESLHFDAYHAFSMQHLVEADVFLMAAAEAGLFPKPDFSKRFPRTLPFTRISINWFEKRPYTIRHPRLNDLPQLILLEKECRPEALRTTSEAIRQQIERFPNEHCVLELEGLIVGVIYSQRISGIDVLRNSNFMNNPRLHEESGSVIQLLGISVLPQFQDKGLGDQLLEFMLQLSALKGGIESVVGVTRCKNFGHYLPMPMENYILSRNERGQLLDPILRFHEGHGAKIIGCIPNYRPQDKENDGKGVLIGYAIHNRQTVGDRQLKPVDGAGKTKDDEKELDTRAIVVKCIRSLMGRRGRRGIPDFSPEHTLKEIGLDSLDLMELKSLFTQHFGKELDSTFFFKYFTCNTITGYFENRDWENTEASYTTTGLTSPETIPAMDRSRPSSHRQHVYQTQRLPSKGQPASNTEAKKARNNNSHASGFAESTTHLDNSVAIVGISCRFPHGADNTDKYWALLRDGINAITEVPKTRWDVEYFQELDRDNPWKAATRFGGFLDQVDQFDAQFFRIAPVEANHIDPQQRILLETTWEALENAGLNPQALKGTQTGVFIGIHNHDYEMLQLKQSDDNDCSPYFATSNSASVASGRLSYFFDFQGPAISVDTACSSSLVALHLACQSLLRGECDLAVAAGVNLLLSPELSITYSKTGMLSQDGRCKTFDASANGYVRSEGCGVVVLKRLQNALSDNDNVLAIVRGTAVNQDGSSNGLTAPNGFSQEAVIRKALEVAGVFPNEVSYVEAHGTGTPLGDPVEVKALEAVYSQGRRKDQPLIIGSVKTNIGHAEAAAGIAGLIKVVLSLQNNHIPPHLHFKEVNPHISLDLIPAVVPTTGMEWKKKTSGKPRLAAVSSFGSSGTNSHVIVEEAPALATLPAVRENIPQLFVLSAKSEEALRQLAQANSVYLESHSEVFLDEVCFTARTGRANFDHRLAVVASSTKHLSEQLGAYVAGRGSNELLRGIVLGKQDPGIAFLFTGQGSQYAGMGRELFETQPRFRETLERCAEILRPYLEKPLLDVIYPQTNVRSPIDQTYYTQPALFAIEYALADLWKSWGIQPSIVMGHSVGEYVAACVAGVFSLEDGLKLIAARGRLMQSLPAGGKMAAVFANEQQVASAIGPYANEVSMGAINGPESVVISGVGRLVDEVAANLRKQGFESVELTVSHAFHSPLMQPILSDFMKIAEDVRFFPPCIELISNVTGKPATGEIATPAYWRNHIRQPVRFADSMQTLHRQGYEMFLEAGPKPTLLGMGRRCLPDESTPGSESPLKWLPSLQPGVSDRQQLLQSLGSLYIHGQAIDWLGFDDGRVLQKVSLPTYPWQRKTYWIPAARKHRGMLYDGMVDRSFGFHGLKGRRLLSPALKDHIYEFILNIDSMPFLSDHRVYGEIVLPAPVLMEIALSAARAAFGNEFCILEDFRIHQGLVFDGRDKKTLQVILKRDGSEFAKFEVMNLLDESAEDSYSWENLAAGTIQSLTLYKNTELSPPVSPSYAEIQERYPEQVSVEEFYHDFDEMGVQFGPLFHAIESISRSEGEAFARIRLPEPLEIEAQHYKIHPVLLDACLQLLTTTWSNTNKKKTDKELFLLYSLDRFQQHNNAKPSPLCYATVQSRSQSEQKMYFGDVQLFNEEGACVAEAKGVCLKRAGREALIHARSRGIDASLFKVVWHPSPRFDQIGERSAPTYLPSPQHIAEELCKNEITVQPDDERHLQDTLLPLLDQLCATCILRIFGQLGWEMAIGDVMSIEDFVNKLGLMDQHRRLLTRMFEMLQEDGIVTNDGSQWRVILVPKIGDPAKMLSLISERYPEYHIELTILGSCLENLSGVLRGKIDPVNLLFPNGSVAMAEKMYQDAPLSRRINALVRKAMSIIAKQVPTGRVLKILEIGGGTGGTTAHILPELPPGRTEYVFTDISNFFLEKAREKFRECSFISYQTLNIEKNPEEQGIAPHQFDLILASNVIHATADLRQTLHHVSQILAPDGLLLLVEGVQPARWIDMIFGLTTGWWRFIDTDLRPNHPLITGNKWIDILNDQHFREVTVTPSGDGKSGAVFEQAVILAQGSALADFEADHEREIPLLDGFLRQLGKAQGNWLIFADQSRIGTCLAEMLQAKGEHCILVFPGRSYEILTDGRRRINPTQAEDYKQLALDVLGPEKLPCRAAIFLWGIDAELSGAPLGNLEKLAVNACSSLVYLIDSLLAAEEIPIPRIWIATRGAQSLSQNEKPQLAQAPLWGMGRVVAVEHPELWGGLLDLDPNGTGDEAALNLLNHICHRDGENQVMVRAKSCYIPCLVPWTELPESPLRWVPEGNYLITGGLGDLGLQTARWMVNQGARRLILLGRTPLPDRTEWNSIAPNSPHFRRISAIQGLEASGACVKTGSVDVADEKQLRSFLEQLHTDGWTPIRGIIHTAVVAKDMLLNQLDTAGFQQVWRPKATGAWLLHHLLESEPLDFFILFSSLGSLLGQTGQGSYAAANAFLDALAHYRCAQGQPAMSVNWGSWIGSGLAITPGGKRTIKNLSLGGIESISPQKATEAMGVLMQGGATQATVTGVNWKRFRTAYTSDTGYLTLSQWTRHWVKMASEQVSGEEIKKGKFIRDQLFATEQGAQRRSILENYLSGTLADVLKLDVSAIHHDKPFGEMGLDSLMALEMKGRCERSLGLKLSASMAWNHPTIHILATYLSEKLGVPLDEPEQYGAEKTSVDRLLPDELREISDIGVLSSVDKLSDEEVLQALLRKAKS